MFVFDENKRGETLGNGGFGKVVVYGEKHVVKIIPASNFQDLRWKLKEITLGFNHKHPLLVPNLGFDLKEVRKENTNYEIYLKMPKMSKTLFAHINDEREKITRFSKEQAIRYFYCLASGLCYLHDCKIAHKDIKPGNVFYNEKDQTLLVGDFGLSSFCADDDPALTRVGGTKGYWAPEVAKEKDMPRSKFMKADSWSLGVTMLEICLLKPARLPTHEKSKGEIENLVKKLLKEVNEKYGDEELSQIIGKLLVINPHKRISCKELYLLLENKYGKNLQELTQKLKDTKQSESNQKRIDALQELINNFNEKFKIQPMESMEYLSIRPTDYLSTTDETLEKLQKELSIFHNEFENIKGLSLDFSWFQKLPTQGIQNLFRALESERFKRPEDSKQLEQLEGLTFLSLNFSQCREINYNLLENILSSLKNSNSLTKLSLYLSGCQQISKDDLQNLLDLIKERFKELEYLTLDLTETGINLQNMSSKERDQFVSMLNTKLKHLDAYSLIILRGQQISKKTKTEFLKKLPQGDEWIIQ